MVTRPFRVGLVACFHETNTFASRPTNKVDFERRDGWLRGRALLDAYVGTRTVIGGMASGADEHGLELAPLFGAFATPSGRVSAAAFQMILHEVSTAMQASEPLDAMLVELHGSMVVENNDDPEALLLGTLRSVVGDLPLVVVTDLHANMTAQRVALVDALVGYRTNPHVDTFERGVDAARHVARLLSGELRTRLHHRRIPILAAPMAQSTATGPLRSLLATARELEVRHELVDVTVHAGYAYSDVPHAGMSVTVTAPDGVGDAATLALDVLSRQAWDMRHGFELALPSAREAVHQAHRLARESGQPVVIADTGDNINGGGSGDATWLLQAALHHADVRILATLCDPQAVHAAAAAGLGGRISAKLGGRLEPGGGTPVQGDAEVRWLGDGTFTNVGPMARGARVTMGPTAVLSIGAVDVVVQTLPVQPNDPAMFHHVNLDPGAYELILLKGAAALRAGWDSNAADIIAAGTPGLTDCDLGRLRFANLSDVWPFKAAPSHELRAATRRTQ